MSLNPSENRDRFTLVALLTNSAHYRPIMIDLNRVSIKDAINPSEFAIFAGIGAFSDHIKLKNVEISNSSSLTSILHFAVYGSVTIENATFRNIPDIQGSGLTLLVNIITNLTNIRFDNYVTSNYPISPPVFMTHLPFSALFLDLISIENSKSSNSAFITSSTSLQSVVMTNGFYKNNLISNGFSLLSYVYLETFQIQNHTIND